MKDPENLFNGEKLLITGGAGYLASNLVEKLINYNCQILRFDRPGTRFVSVTGKAEVEDIQGDIREPNIWHSLLDRVSIVFHFAGQTSVQTAEQDPEGDFAVNVLPMIHLLEICKKMGNKISILFSGTATQMGLPVHIPVDENQADHPITFYDLHKGMAETYLKYYAKQGIVNGAVLRLANVYGPGPVNSSVDRGILNLMIHRALQGEPLTVYGSGCYLRDYIYVDDVIQAFLKAAENIGKINGRHFVIGSEQGYTINDAFNLIKERVELKTGRPVTVIHIDRAVSEIESRNFVADSCLFKHLTSWKPVNSLTEGIDSTISFFLDN